MRWAGRIAEYDTKRSIPFQLFKRLFVDLPDIDWVALVEDGEALRALQPHPLLDVSAHLADLYATGAVACNLDLIICVDTSIAHLAGALGLPTWMAARPDLGWRWGETGDTGPWYGSVRVFRHAPGSFDWEAVVDRIEGELAAWLRQPLAPPQHRSGPG